MSKNKNSALEMWGIDPHASRMQGESSTIWATFSNSYIFY